MTAAIVPPPWSEDGWLDEVTIWVHEHAERAGLHAAGPFDQVRSEPWSVVLRLPIVGGSVYFKEPAPYIRHEVTVSAILARLQPRRVLPLLAVDTERFWMLAPDAGAILRPTIRADGDMGHWDRLLPEYAALQMELSGHVDELLEAGIPDRRIERLPDLLSDVLDDTPSLLIGQEKGLDEEEYDRARALIPRLTDLGAQLSAFEIPASLHHGDLHDANVFYDGTRYLIFDWSDCSVTHPFFSLRTAVVSVLISFELEDAQETETALRLWQGYGPAWSRFGDPDELRAAFDVARRLWSLPTLLSWYRLISNLEGESRAKYAWIIPEVIRELLEANQA